MLVIFMRFCGFEMRNSCEFVLDPSSVPLFNNFGKETDEEPHEFDMLAQMRKNISCNL